MHHHISDGAMRFVYSGQYEADIGAHVFPTSKYRLIRQKLLAEGLVEEHDFVEPPLASHEELLLVHTPEMVADIENLRWTPRTMHSELPISRQIVNAYILAAGGTTVAARTALTQSSGLCVHIGGGFHHAFADHAEGFCYINDIAVGVRVMQREQRIKRALVIDCDLHQGNGTASIFENDPDVFTISIHQEHNYPLKQRSNIDVGLEDFTADKEYLEALKRVYPPALDQHKPELVIYVAGADPFEEDKLGALKLTFAGLKERDEIALGEARRRNIPAVVVLAGGYARRNEDTVAIHTETCRVALQLAVG